MADTDELYYLKGILVNCNVYALKTMQYNLFCIDDEIEMLSDDLDTYNPEVFEVSHWMHSPVA